MDLKMEVFHENYTVIKLENGQNYIVPLTYKDTTYYLNDFNDKCRCCFVIKIFNKILLRSLCYRCYSYL